MRFGSDSPPYDRSGRPILLKKSSREGSDRKIRKLCSWLQRRDAGDSASAHSPSCELVHQPGRTSRSNHCLCTDVAEKSHRRQFGGFQRNRPIPVTRGAELLAPKRPLAAPADELLDALFKAEAVKRRSFELRFERGTIRVLRRLGASFDWRNAAAIWTWDSSRSFPRRER
jgi:hypothetical protein